MREDNSIVKFVMLMTLIAMLLAFFLPRAISAEDGILIYNGQDISSYKDDGNYYQLTISSTVSSIPANFVQNWANITSIYFQDSSSAISVGNLAFAGLENLYDVYLGRSMSTTATTSSAQTNAIFKASGARYDGVRFFYGTAYRTTSQYVYDNVDMYCFVPAGSENRDGYIYIDSYIESVYIRDKRHIRKIVFGERGSYNTRQYQLTNNMYVDEIILSNTRNYSATNRDRFMYATGISSESGVKVTILDDTTSFAAYLLAGVEVAEIVYGGDDQIQLDGNFLSRNIYSGGHNTRGYTADNPIVIKALDNTKIVQADYDAILPADGSVINLFGAYVKFEAIQNSPSDVFPDNDTNLDIEYPVQSPQLVNLIPTPEQYNSLTTFLQALSDNIDDISNEIKNTMTSTIEFNQNNFHSSIVNWMQSFNVNYFKGLHIFNSYVRIPYSLYIDDAIDNIEILNALYYASCAVTALIIVSRGAL